MEIFQLNKEVGKKITQFHSDFTLSPITKTEKTTQIACIHLEQNGLIGYHQAVVPQLFIVISGNGWVRGKSDEFVAIRPGEVVLWRENEWHETKTDKGLIAIVIEGEKLDTSMLFKKKE
ncbi:cupin [Gracilibacillus sp. S3-1-1]|uniref:Cupin n=1 Tax=Gracilibacillus pellucidus TaxID=3095368 RepID=A0ACC6M0N5_9BACI|nr:cupin [Gracilibacillus sp. S3-1-1]MDX8044514.1 cupin [Gracilibacillus sp. S3-1-1]